MSTQSQLHARANTWPEIQAKAYRERILKVFDEAEPEKREILLAEIGAIAQTLKLKPEPFTDPVRLFWLMRETDAAIVARAQADAQKQAALAAQSNRVAQSFQEAIGKREGQSVSSSMPSRFAFYHPRNGVQVA